MTTPFKRPEKNQIETDTERISITLPAFTLFELDGLVNIYAPSRAQVAAMAIEQWLHDNEEKIAFRKAKHAEYINSRLPKPADKA